MDSKDLAELISISGIGEEKIHMNNPLESQRTTSMAQELMERFKEASVFRLKEEGVGTVHR